MDNQQLMIIVVVAALVIANAMVIILLVNKSKSSPNKDIMNFLKTDLTELTNRVDSLKDAVNSSSTVVSNRLEQSGAQMQNSMSRQLAESSKLVSEVSQRLSKLDETNRRVVDVADELKTLQNVLQNPKQRGVFGEYYLESVLENVMAVNQYKMQYRFKDGETVDAVIFLDKGKILPIDSKFSLENYNRMIEEKNKDLRQTYLNRIKADLKGRIDETSKYIRPGENTMDFAFMFIPSESLYYDLLINNIGVGGSSRDLIEYAFRDKRVIIVSPTSFLAYLQTVLQGLRSLQIEEQAKDIQIQVGKLGTHLRQFDDLFQKMGKSLSTTVNHYNGGYKELGKISVDVLKIADIDNKIQPELIDRPSQED